MEQEFPHKYSLLFINQVKYHVIEEDQSKEVQQYARNHDGAYQIQQMTGNKAQAKPPPKKKQKMDIRRRGKRHQRRIHPYSCQNPWNMKRRMIETSTRTLDHLIAYKRNNVKWQQIE
jgi:hypothetical protein